jgi:hypothetical protein
VPGRDSASGSGGGTIDGERAHEDRPSSRICSFRSSIDAVDVRAVFLSEVQLLEGVLSSTNVERIHASNAWTFLLIARAPA